MKVTDEMVSRFLRWQFPDDFAPDGAISFDPMVNGMHRKSPEAGPGWWPTGTNLLHAGQARAMLEFVLDDSNGPVCG